MNPILWQPRPETAAATQIAALARKRGFEGPEAIHKLWRWSVESPALFWQEVWDLGEIRGSRAADQVAQLVQSLGQPVVTRRRRRQDE